jgi:hypothetical protein
MDRLELLMPQILDYFIEPAYGQVCLSDQDAELSWQATFNDQHVASDETSITIAVTDEEAKRQVEVEVYQGPDDKPPVQYLQRIFDGVINLTRAGLLVLAPTGDEVLLEEIVSGPHQIEIFRDSYPTSRLVVLIDADSQR